MLGGLSVQGSPCLHGLRMSPELCLPLPFACGVALSSLYLPMEVVPCHLPMLTAVALR